MGNSSKQRTAYSGMLRIEPRLINIGSDKANSISHYPGYFNK